jgi:hypothetical protein
LCLQPPELSFIGQGAPAIGMKLQSDATKQALAFAMRLLSFRRKLIVRFVGISGMVPGWGIIFGKGLRSRLLVAGGWVGRVRNRIPLDKFVSRNLFAQSAMVRENLTELAMIPEIKFWSIYLVVPGNLGLQASDGAASATETSCIRPPDRAVIDFD